MQYCGLDFIRGAAVARLSARRHPASSAPARDAALGSGAPHLPASLASAKFSQPKPTAGTDRCCHPPAVVLQRRRHRKIGKTPLRTDQPGPRGGVPGTQHCLEALHRQLQPRRQHILDSVHARVLRSGGERSRPQGARASEIIGGVSCGRRATFDDGPLIT